MKKIALVVGLVIVAALLYFATTFVSVGNRMVTMNEEVKGRWSQVENVYQRRMDLIPNLVATVKGYATHEASVLEGVAQARASAGQVKVNSLSDIQNYAKAQGDVTTALSRLMTVVEKYPDLKADRQFTELRSEIEGTENRISIERKNFNEAAQAFNTYILQFPESIVASIRGFQPRDYFKADAAAASAPKVDFSK